MSAAVRPLPTAAPREFFSCSATYLIDPAARLVDLSVDVVCLLEAAQGVLDHAESDGVADGHPQLLAAIYVVRQALSVARVVNGAIEGSQIEAAS